MFVMIGEEKVEVEVSETGVFYDKETKKHSAGTLKGLQKKIVKDRCHVQGFNNGIPVELENGELGVVTRRASQKGWRRNRFSVTLSDGAVEENNGDSLLKRLTNEERSKKNALQKIEDDKMAEAAEARRVYERYLKSLSVEEMLDAAFPKQELS